METSIDTKCIKIYKEDVSPQDEFVFEFLGVEEVVKTLGMEAAMQGEAAQGGSKSAKRRARKRRAEQQEQQDIEQGRVTREEAMEAKEKRRRGQRDRLGGASVEERVEEVRKVFERQRKEDVRGWEMRFAKMEERTKELEREVQGCFKRKARNGGAGTTKSEKCGGDPRRAQPRV